MKNSTLRISGIKPMAIEDGTGIRYSIYTQGCVHACIGCQNPKTWDFRGGYDIELSELESDIRDSKHISGITLSGGDPFEQADKLLVLVRNLKKDTNLNFWAYTGYKWEDLTSGRCNPDKLELLKEMDVLVDGRFHIHEKDLSLKFRGSSNQRIIKCQESLKAGKVIEANEYY